MSKLSLVMSELEVLLFLLLLLLSGVPAIAKLLLLLFLLFLDRYRRVSTAARCVDSNDDDNDVVVVGCGRFMIYILVITLVAWCSSYERCL